MANEIQNLNLALFCDFENIALGVRDAKYAMFDIQRVL
ncbi:MAG: NYN domain-containing protein, partial [Gammaproteobacteria bacterium]|nr:NYN domain-containing protein [Gammaproteobacteria bacterium]